MKLKLPEPSARGPAADPAAGAAADASAGNAAAAVRLWQLLHGCATLVEQELRRQLHDAFSTSHPRFALMAELARVPGGLRMGELSKRLKVAAGSVTTLADQLEAEGIVVRTRSATDRRVQTLALTPAGHALLATMAGEHERWLRALLGNLPASDVHALVVQLGALERALQASASGKRARRNAGGNRRAAPDGETALHLCWPPATA